MTAQAYPLQWPDHIPRATRRENSRFKTTLAGAERAPAPEADAYGARPADPDDHIPL